MIEPYLYKISGKEVLMTSLVTPIVQGGQFKGIVGVGYLLAGLQQTVDKVKSLRGSRVTLISQREQNSRHPNCKPSRRPWSNWPQASGRALRRPDKPSPRPKRQGSSLN